MKAVKLERMGGGKDDGRRGLRRDCDLKEINGILGRRSGRGSKDN